MSFIYKVILGTGLVISGLFLACTPQISEETTQEENDDQTTVESQGDSVVLSHCAKFKDSDRRGEVLDAYSIYSDFLELEKYTESFDYWKTVYENAPAGFGKRPVIFTDGILYYEHFYQTTQDSAEKEKYIDKILNLYQEAIECFPDDKPMLVGRRAFDYYYRYTDRKTDRQMFQMFKFTINKMGKNAPVYTINPFMDLLYNGYSDDEISRDTAKKYAYIVYEAIDANKDKKQNQKSWNIVEDYSLQQLTNLEGEKDFFPCEYYRSVYLPMYKDNRKSCDTIRLVYSKLQWGKCKNIPAMKEMKMKLDSSCQEVIASGDSPVSKAFDDMRDGNYSEAIDGFKSYLDRTEDIEKRSKIALLIAKIYYAHLRQFSTARSWARKAADIKSNWGEPYLLIGRMYASSGPLCGPGTGWDSQVVVWPAIDKWNYAKQIDPSVTTDADRLINNYSQYMPSISDIFSRPNIKEGDSYTVDCWIQETTTVRAAPKD